jgi:hypothetical protein
VAEFPVSVPSCVAPRSALARNSFPSIFLDIRARTDTPEGIPLTFHDDLLAARISVRRPGVRRTIPLRSERPEAAKARSTSVYDRRNCGGSAHQEGDAQGDSPIALQQQLRHTSSSHRICNEGNLRASGSLTCSRSLFRGDRQRPKPDLEPSSQSSACLFVAQASFNAPIITHPRATRSIPAEAMRKAEPPESAVAGRRGHPEGGGDLGTGLIRMLLEVSDDPGP